MKGPAQRPAPTNTVIIMPNARLLIVLRDKFNHNYRIVDENVGAGLCAGPFTAYLSRYVAVHDMTLYSPALALAPCPEEWYTEPQVI
jgi:hypothetical protein